jgi:hypothetical protein
VHSQQNQNKGNFPDPQGQVHTGSSFDDTVSRPRQLLSHAASRNILDVISILNVFIAFRVVFS